MMRGLAWALLLVGCGGEAATRTVTITPNGTASSSAGAIASPATGEPFSCMGDVASATPIARPERNPPTAAQMSETAARAKRLFDSEKWEFAIDALKHVADGSAGDDDGNKQLAGYHAAIALYRLNRFRESHAAFRVIAQDRNHLKNRETMLWLVKLAQAEPELVEITDFDAYTESDIAIFDNANQHDLHQALLFLVGRARVRTGEIEEARRLLSAVEPENAYRGRAVRCIGALHR